MHLKALVATLLLASPIAYADVHGEVKVKVKMPSVVIRDRDRPPPRTYVRFDDYKDYDSDDKVRVRADISGTYDSEYGRLSLKQEGSRVWGTYLTKDGITGNLKGRIRANGQLNYRWQQAGSEGQGTWFVNNNGRNKRIKGTWGTFDSRNNAGAWNLIRIDDQAPPPPPAPPAPPPAPPQRDHRH